MPLVAAGLSAAIKSELDAVSPVGTTQGGLSGSVERQKFADAVAKAVVDHIKANALVTTTVTGIDSMGGPVTGSGTGTVA
jgi:hypothetical protein